MADLMRGTAPQAPARAPGEQVAMEPESVARAVELASQLEFLSRIAGELLVPYGADSAEQGPSAVAPVLDVVARVVTPLATPRVHLGVSAGALPPVAVERHALERQVLLLVLRVLAKVPGDARGWEMRITACGKRREHEVRIEITVGPGGSEAARTSCSLPMAS